MGERYHGGEVSLCLYRECLFLHPSSLSLYTFTHLYSFRSPFFSLSPTLESQSYFYFHHLLSLRSSESPFRQSSQLMYIYRNFHHDFHLSLLVIPHTAPLSCLVTARFKPHHSRHTIQRHTSRTKMPHNTHLPHHSTPSQHGMNKQ